MKTTGQNNNRTGFLSPDRFRYEAERDVYMCPAGKELRFDRAHSTERSLRYRARAIETKWAMVTVMASRWQRADKSMATFSLVSYSTLQYNCLEA